MYELSSSMHPRTNGTGGGGREGEEKGNGEGEGEGEMEGGEEEGEEEGEEAGAIPAPMHRGENETHKMLLSEAHPCLLGIHSLSVDVCILNSKHLMMTSSMF